MDEYLDTFAFNPEGNFYLTFRNEDKPGAILQVLDVLNNELFDDFIAGVRGASWS